MKRFIILAMLITASIPALCQESNDGLTIKDGNVIWQKVYNTALSQEIALQNIHSEGIYTGIYSSDGFITFRISGYKPRYEELGLTRSKLPIYIGDGIMTASVTIQIKPDRYRVTVERIVLTLDRLGSTAIDDAAIDGMTFSSKFKDSKAGQILNYNFDMLFGDLSTQRLNNDF